MGQYLGQGVGQGQVAEFLVMPVVFPVRGHVQELEAGAARSEALHQTAGKAVTIGEQVAEAQVRGHVAIVKKDVDIAPFAGLSRRLGEEAAVGLGAVEAVALDCGPVAAAQGAHPFGLVRGEDDELHAVVHQGRQGGVIYRGLRQPQGCGRALKAVLEVFEAPDDLGFPVPGVAQGQDGMAVSLGDGVAVPQGREALAVGLQDLGIGFRGLVRQPTDQGGAEIEADMFVVVDNVQDAVLAVINPGRGVGAVTFGIDAGVPIVEGMGAGLHLDLLDPGVLPGGLIEMAVDDHVS